MAIRIAKGAEADLHLIEDWNGKKVVIKTRKPKRYRHQDLDRELRRYRTIHEADIIHRAKMHGVPTPLLYQVDPENAHIVMEYVEGMRVRDLVDDLTRTEREQLFYTIGLMSGRLHKSGIIHGDLTTSNIIKTEEHPVFIDFGLAEISTEVEKRGVDLNLMRRMLTSTHYRYSEELLESYASGYSEAMGDEAEEALIRMEEVAQRGRYIEKS